MFFFWNMLNLFVIKLYISFLCILINITNFNRRFINKFLFFILFSFFYLFLLLLILILDINNLKRIHQIINHLNLLLLFQMSTFLILIFFKTCMYRDKLLIFIPVDDNRLYIFFYFFRIWSLNMNRLFCRCFIVFRW